MRDPCIIGSPPSANFTAAVAIVVRGQRGVEGDAVAPELSRHAEHAHAHAEFGHRVSRVRRKPLRAHIQRRRQVQNVRIGGLFQMRDAGFRSDERAARIDAVHQIVALHVGLDRARQADRRGVVDADIDAAELRDRFGHRVHYIGFVAHVDDQRQRLAAGFLYLLCGSVDRAGSLG